MEKIIKFPTRVQYNKEYLTKNPRVKQRQGIAQRLTRGHEGVVTIEWEGVKSIGHVHLDFLEEVLPATTITMEKNTQLPVEKCPECGGLNGGHSNRRCSLMTIEYAQQEIINVEQKWLKINSEQYKHFCNARDRLIKMVSTSQGKIAVLKHENNKLRRQNAKLKQQATGWRPLLEEVLKHDAAFGELSIEMIDNIKKILYGE